MKKRYVIYKKETEPNTNKVVFVEIKIGGSPNRHLDHAEIALKQYLDRFPLMRAHAYTIILEFEYEVIDAK